MGLTPNSDNRQNHGKQLAAVHQVMFDNRPKRKSREKGQRADDQNGAYKEADKQRPVRWEGSRCCGYLLLRSQATGGGQKRDQEQETSDPHRQTDREVVPRRTRGES